MSSSLICHVRATEDVHKQRTQSFFRILETPRTPSVLPMSPDVRTGTAARLLLPLLRSMNLLWGSELSMLMSISSGHAKSGVAIIVFLRNYQGAGNQSQAASSTSAKSLTHRE